MKSVETVIVAGTPWEQIDRLAEELRADLVVMGTHGRHGLVRALMGSVAAHVVQACQVSNEQKRIVALQSEIEAADAAYARRFGTTDDTARAPNTSR